MRLKRLHLKAFGPFTDRTLEFDSQQPGLHIVFGHNEAGKSTSLRALKALLYGFQERTADNFEHANAQLLVGGCLEGSDGQELAFLRRKKRKGDLLDLDGNLMEHGTLANFLHGIEPSLFESLYGIDHRTLVEGGEDILAQKGEVGQALFAAGAGISSLKKVLDSLAAEADELFKARGAKQQINQAINEYKELKKVVKEASLPSSRWKEHKKRLQNAEDEQVRLEGESRHKSAEVQRLNRLKKAIPELAELRNLHKQLGELGDVVILPPEFSDQLRHVEQSIREIKLQIDKDQGRLTKLQTKQDGISLNTKLLGQAESIVDLHQRLGEYRKGLKDRSRLDGMRIAYRKDAGGLVAAIRPGLTLEDAESLRPVLGKKRTIQDLSSRYESLTQQALQTRKQKDAAENELKEIAEALSRLPPIRNSGGLTKAVQLALRIGDVDGQIKEISREVGARKKNCQAELNRLGLWSGGLGQLLELTLPLAATVRRFETHYSELDKERQQLKKDRNKVEADLKTAGADHQELVYGGEVPTEQDLQETREKRQEGWQLLLRQWLDGEDISIAAVEYAQGQPLHKVFEKNILQADHIADRLRREAERVAKVASLRARIESLEETRAEISQLGHKLSKRQADLTETWENAWKAISIKPLTPKEMLAWLTDIDTLRFKMTEAFAKEGEVIEKDAARQQYRTSLLEELRNFGESEEFATSELAPVLVFAESVLANITHHKAEFDKLSDKQTQIQTALVNAQKEQKNVDTARGDWQKMWDKALAGLRMKDRLLPSEALDLLETIGDLFDKLEKTQDFKSRITGIDRDIDKFTDDVQTLLQQAAPDMQNLSPDQAVLQLHSMLDTARRDHELLKKNREEAEVLTAESESAEKTLHNLAGQMAELLATARCDQAADLAGAIRKSVEYQRLQEKISDAESSLAKVSEGVSLEEIISQAGEVDVDELPGRIASLKRQIEEELYPKIKDILKLIGEENRELQLMDGSSRAADAAEKMEQIGAGIRRLVAQYTRLKLAAVVLKDEIERYREQHQDPVLQIGSRIFTELTLGSFAGLRTDMDDNGNPILVGVRQDESRVVVDGMSSGTRDQLFLALRLATLEWRLETSEPMPFIVDDILINFDDERSEATLKVLTKLAAKNQVIIFTHHRQIVDSAKEIRGGAVYVHEL